MNRAFRRLLGKKASEVLQGKWFQIHIGTLHQGKRISKTFVGQSDRNMLVGKLWTKNTFPRVADNFVPKATRKQQAIVITLKGVPVLGRRYLYIRILGL